MPTQLADVIYRDMKAGVLFWDAVRRVAVFEYTPEFIESGINLAPLQMPLRSGPFQFPGLHNSFSGLPGLLADSLPDTYGNTLIDEWIRRQGRSPSDFSPVERLCYMGNRGMGALEFRPSLRSGASKAEKVDVDRLVALASEALAFKEGLSTDLQHEDALNDILQVGTSAAGARAKAVIAWNPVTNEVRSGQAEAPEGFEHWLMKFDGVSASFDGIHDPQGYGRIEYAYYLMARRAGIAMAECRLFEEGGRAHFMTRRFDRSADGGKIHMASLFGMAHMAYSAPGEHSHSYEDYFETIRALNLTPAARLEAFRRMAFNILGCNKDDHSKNFAFLMGNDGEWMLAPAFDLAYAHNPRPGRWTALQQLSVTGKRENITPNDLITCGRNGSVATVHKLKSVLGEVTAALEQWKSFAEKAGVEEKSASAIDQEVRCAIKGRDVNALR